jgi:hypothetical protein
MALYKVSTEPSAKSLSGVTRRNLRAYAGAIKSVIDESSLVPARKDRLYDKINAFIFELDRERMPLQKFHDVILSLATTGARQQSTVFKCCAREIFSLHRST